MNDPPWAHDFTEGEFHAQCASAYRSLAVTDRGTYGDHASDWSIQAVNGFPPEGTLARSRVFNLIGLSTAHFLAREPEGGPEPAHTAIREARTLGSTRIQDRLGRLRGLMVPYMDLAAVHDLDDALRTALPP